MTPELQQALIMTVINPRRVSRQIINISVITVDLPTMKTSQNSLVFLQGLSYGEANRKEWAKYLSRCRRPVAAHSSRTRF
jgi:hypothetical protein